MTNNKVESERFAELCVHDEMVFGENEKIGINIYNEKRLHRVLKKTLCNNEDCFEVKVGRYIADVKEGNRITEIQCGSLYPLAPKLEYYLGEDDIEVTVVHPIIARKRIIKTDKETGEIKSSKMSPKKESEWTALPELYWLRELIPSPRLKIRFMFISADEYRYSERVRGRKSGAYDASFCPRELLGSMEFSSVEDYRCFIPEALIVREGFSSADYSAATKLKGKKLSGALKFLCSVGVLERQKQDRRFIYSIKS